MRSGSFTAVAASSPDDAWAVGSGRHGTTDGPLAEHWDGVRWTIVPTPFRNGAFTDVAANADDAWAPAGLMERGESSSDITHAQQPNRCFEHWDGRRCATDAGSWTGVFRGALGVCEDGAGGIWVLGGERTKAMARHHLPLRDALVHWDGTAWKRIAVPRGFLLSDLAAVSTDDVWLVGVNASLTRGVAMHWTGIRWRVDHPSRPPRIDSIELTASPRSTQTTSSSLALRASRPETECSTARRGA